LFNAAAFLQSNRAAILRAMEARDD
jgi:hypothetical protein